MSRRCRKNHLFAGGQNLPECQRDATFRITLTEPKTGRRTEAFICDSCTSLFRARPRAKYAYTQERLMPPTGRTTTAPVPEES